MSVYIKAKSEHINKILSLDASVKIPVDSQTARMVSGKEKSIILVENTKNGLIGRKVKPDSCGLEEKARWWLVCHRELSEGEKKQKEELKKSKR
jgi:hypothetical protein